MASNQAHASMDAYYRDHGITIDYSRPTATEIAQRTQLRRVFHLSRQMGKTAMINKYLNDKFSITPKAADSGK